MCKFMHLMRQTIQFECILVEVVVPFIRCVCSTCCYLCTSLRAEVSLLHVWLLAFTK